MKIAAAGTSKGMPISVADSSTLGAGFTCVARINRHDRDTKSGSFVFNKLTQLVKGPGVKIASLLLALLGGLANTSQVLKDDNWVPVLSRKFHNALGCDMVRQKLSNARKGIKTYTIFAGISQVEGDAQFLTPLKQGVLLG